METYAISRALAPEHLRCLITGQRACLGAQVDPLRNFIRRQNEGIDVILRRMQQFEALRKGCDCGPVSNYAV